jgi:hypothetical protein
MRTGLAFALAVAVLGASSGVAASAPTSLRITYWEDGTKAVSTVWTIRCNPPGGTLPRPRLACRKLSRGGAKLFAPIPPNTACTEIWGGPQRARVVGTVAGKPVRAVFTRTNGCEIARWNALAPWLLPPGGARS